MPVGANPLQREGGREGDAANRANVSTDVAAAMGGGMADDAAPLSMKTERARHGGGFCYPGNSHDVMCRVEVSPDWLEGCGAPLAEGGGGER